MDNLKQKKEQTKEINILCGLLENALINISRVEKNHYLNEKNFNRIFFIYLIFFKSGI